MNTVVEPTHRVANRDAYVVEEQHCLNTVVEPTQWVENRDTHVVEEQH